MPVTSIHCKTIPKICEEVINNSTTTLRINIDVYTSIYFTKFTLLKFISSYKSDLIHLSELIPPLGIQTCSIQMSDNEKASATTTLWFPMNLEEEVYRFFCILKKINF
jgi:hypothetical protein